MAHHHASRYYFVKSHQVKGVSVTIFMCSADDHDLFTMFTPLRNAKYKIVTRPWQARNSMYYTTATISNNHVFDTSAILGLLADNDYEHDLSIRSDFDDA
eukprot:TRINITY_DN2215_c0_g1_i1.p3 TRINITY_DN2215_c0_g1~~TRINITY_DN2215_c0_g1_i1.p3  ORF type:complete len:100 (-),score=30.36 TRINITY_DN2215_c0_g1_i1:274-573(-)